MNRKARAKLEDLSHVTPLWRENRLDQGWKITDREYINRFRDWPRRHDIARRRGIDMAMRLFTAEPDGLNSVWEAADFDALFDRVSGRLNDELIIHVRKVDPGKPGGRYAALKPLGDASTLCGAEPNTIDVPQREVRVTLSTTPWGDFVCGKCVSLVNPAQPCPDCEGHGYQRAAIDIDGGHAQYDTCRRCDGSGQIGVHK